MTNNLIIQDADFETIKQNLINYLKSQDEFKDYEYTGSGLNILLDTLSYNSHYMIYYAHMLANESMIESIIRKENMNSKARFFNYLPKSKKSSKCTVTLTVPDPSPNNYVKIDRGTSYQAKHPVSGSTDPRYFVLIDDLYIYYNDETSDYTSDEVQLYEGEYKTTAFNSGSEKRYIIRDTNIDTDTIKVIVKTSKNATSGITYSVASDFTEINAESTVFFITLNEDDYYEISFGNDVYGRSVPDNYYIEVTYVSCNGKLGNTVKEFVDSEITVIEESTDGSDAESLEDMRHNIPYHYRRQNRLVTVDDFKNIILSEYKNVSSVNVWGGEDNIPKAYGKVYICIKPLYGEQLSNQSSQNLLILLKKYTMATIEPVIVQPEYTYINLTVNIKNNTLLTNKRHGELRDLVTTAIRDYNTNQLNKFDSYYSDVKLNIDIMDQSPSFITTYNNIVLEKRFVPTLLTNQTYFTYFKNEIEVGSLTSNNFYFRNKKCTIKDDSKGNIEVYYYDDNKKSWIKFSGETFGEIDYTEGSVKLSDIVFASLIDSDIKLFVKPVNPLFFAKLNDILIINDILVNIDDYHGRENEK